jgi:hypothetical protein
MGRAVSQLLIIGGEGLDKDDMFLLEINLDDLLDSSTRDDQEYWLLALQAAREATQLGGNQS